MALNNVQSIGDDQRWKTEVELAILDIIKRLTILEQNTRGK